MRFVGRHGGTIRLHRGRCPNHPNPLPIRRTPPPPCRRCSGGAPAMLRPCSGDAPDMLRRTKNGGKFIPTVPPPFHVPPIDLYIVGNPTKSACLFGFQTKGNKTRVMVRGDRSYIPSLPQFTSLLSICPIDCFHVSNTINGDPRSSKPLCAGSVP